MLRPRRTPRRTTLLHRQGAAVVEFGILAPILFFLFLGMVEVTRLVQVKHTLNDAVRSAARLAIQPGRDATTVTDNAKSILSDNGLATTNAQVVIKINDAAGGDLKYASQNAKISVQVTIPASDVGWLSPIFMAKNAIQSETIHMLRQR